MFSPNKIILLLFLILSVAGSSCSIDRKFNPALEREVAGSVRLSSDWLEIAPKEPLKPEREIHEVIVFFPNPYMINSQGGQQSPTGIVAIPEIQLVDQSGKVFNLAVSSQGETAIGYSFRDESHQEVLPKDRTYRAIRLRSDKPVDVERIVWRCYNPWDYK